MTTDTTAGVLLPYQKKWVEDKSPVKLCAKSRRVGLSWCEAADDVLTAGSSTGMDVWYIGYNKDMALEFINDCANWAKIFGLAAGEMSEMLFDDADKDILSFRITFASGYRITALSSRPNNLRGKQGKVVIDEAAFHDNLDELLKSAIALLMWGGRVVIISTHDGDTNPFNELIKEIEAGKKPYSIHKITLDDALRQGLYKQICRVRKLTWSVDAEAAWRQSLFELYGNAADEELLCIPRSSNGAFLKLTEIEQAMDDTALVVRLALDNDFTTKPDAERNAFIVDWCAENLGFIAELPKQKAFVGGDFARTKDLTDFWIALEQPNTDLHCAAVVELRNVPYTEQEYIYKYIIDNLPDFRASALDARNNGGYLAERAVQKYGSRVAAVQITQKFYIDTMPKMQAMIQDRSFTIPKHTDIKDDLRSLELVKGIASPSDKRRKGSDGKDRHGDSAVAAAMAVYAARLMESSMPPSYEPVNSTDHGKSDDPENFGFNVVSGY